MMRTALLLVGKTNLNLEWDDILITHQKTLLKSQYDIQILQFVMQLICHHHGLPTNQLFIYITTYAYSNQDQQTDKDWDFLH